VGEECGKGEDESVREEVSEDRREDSGEDGREDSGEVISCAGKAFKPMHLDT